MHLIIVADTFEEHLHKFEQWCCNRQFKVKKKINGKAVDKHGLDFIDYWGAVAKQARKQNIRIIDASGGVLECFEKQKYEDVFELYGGQNGINEAKL